MEPFALLAAHDDTVYSWVCGKCRHIPVVGEKMHAYSNADVLWAAEEAKRQAEACCTCKHCGGYQDRWELDQTVEEGEGPGPWRAQDCCLKCWPVQRELQKQHMKEWMAIEDKRISEREQSLEASSDKISANLLESLMRDISEEQHCAGWVSGLEFYLWSLVERDGLSGETLSEGKTDALRTLSANAGGWWMWNEFVPLERWRHIYAAFIKDNQ